MPWPAILIGTVWMMVIRGRLVRLGWPAVHPALVELTLEHLDFGLLCSGVSLELPDELVLSVVLLDS